jgi:hypothetical protein
MWLITPQVQQDLGVRRTAGVLQGVSQDDESVAVEVAGGEQAVLVVGLGQPLDEAAVVGQDGRGDGRQGPEGQGADKVAEQAGLGGPLVSELSGLDGVPARRSGRARRRPRLRRRG